MMRPMLGAAIMAIAVLQSSPAAFANDESRDLAARAGTAATAHPAPKPLVSDETGEPRMSEVAGIRIVPSILAHDVYLRPSAWIMRTGGGWANADARVYTDREGAITGLTLSAWGLPETTRYGQADRHYVIWLVNTDDHRVQNIGELEARNQGKAVFGYTPDHPVVGFNHIAITQEPEATVSWPTGWPHLEADLPRTVAANPAEKPPEIVPVTPNQRHPMDERRGTSTGPLNP